MKPFLSILWVFLWTSGFTQPDPVYVPPEQVPRSYYFDSDAELERVFKDAETSFKSDLRKQYAQQLVAYHQHLLRSGSICMGLDHFERYAQRLADTICSVADIKKPFRVFIVNDETANASAFDNGFIYVHIGLFAATDDEAALMGVLGHEISHAVHNDGRTSFAVSRTRQPAQSEAGKLIITGHSSRTLESRADNDGFRWAQKLGYDVTGCRAYFDRFETDYQWYRSQYDYKDAKWQVALDRIGKDRDVHPDSLEFLVMGHPRNAERISRLKSICEGASGRRFIVDSVAFMQIHRESIREQLRISFIESDFRSCLRNALYYYLADQKNPDYLYYLCEATRRLMMSEPGRAHTGFLTDESKDRRFEGGKKGILHAPEYLLDAPLFINLVNTDSIYGGKKKPFETYDEAYRWFFSLSAPTMPHLHFGHSLLDLFRGRKKSAENHLRKYLASGDQRWSKLATALLENPAALSDMHAARQDFFLIQDVEYYRYRKDGARYDRKKSIAATALFREFVADLEFNRMRAVLSYEFTGFAEVMQHLNILKRLEEFKPKSEADVENAESLWRDDRYWRSREIKEPNHPEVMQRRKDFFAVHPELQLFYADSRCGAIVVVKPYVLKVPLYGEYIFCEMAYFDPTTKKYFYSDQQQFVRFNEYKVNALLREFKARGGMKD